MRMNTVEMSTSREKTRGQMGEIKKRIRSRRWWRAIKKAGGDNKATSQAIQITNKPVQKHCIFVKCILIFYVFF